MTTTFTDPAGLLPSRNETLGIDTDVELEGTKIRATFPGLGWDEVVYWGGSFSPRYSGSTAEDLGSTRHFEIRRSGGWPQGADMVLELAGEGGGGSGVTYDYVWTGSDWPSLYAAAVATPGPKRVHLQTDLSLPAGDYVLDDFHFLGGSGQGFNVNTASATSISLTGLLILENAWIVSNGVSVTVPDSAFATVVVRAQGGLYASSAHVFDVEGSGYLAGVLSQAETSAAGSGTNAFHGASGTSIHVQAEGSSIDAYVFGGDASVFLDLRSCIDMTLLGSTSPFGDLTTMPTIVGSGMAVANELLFSSDIDTGFNPIPGLSITGVLLCSASAGGLNVKSLSNLAAGAAAFDYVNVGSHSFTIKHLAGGTDADIRTHTGADLTVAPGDRGRLVWAPNNPAGYGWVAL